MSPASSVVQAHQPVLYAFVFSSVLLNAAMNTFWRQVRRLIDHPEAPPFEAGLTEIFRLIHEFLAPQMRIGGVQIQWETARSIDYETPQHGCENEPTHVLIPPLVTYTDNVVSTTPCTRENIGCTGYGT